jgi:hypothetical protein
MYALSYDVNIYFSTFLKGLLCEILACFKWAIYTGSNCSLHSCLIFLGVKTVLLCFLLRNPFIYSFT